GRLDLTVRHVRRLEGLDAELTERDSGPALGRAVAVRVVLLAVLDAPRDQHCSALRCCALGRGSGCSLRRRSGGGLDGSGLLVATLATTGTTVRTTAATTATGGSSRRRGALLRLALGARAGDVALVDPDLHADAAEGGAGLEEPVVDVGAQRVQRDAALAVELRPRHLGAAETTRALDPDALRAGLGRALQRLAHRATERHAAGQLLGDALGDQLRVDLGVLHLEDVQLHLLAGQVLQPGADAVGLGAAAADHDARTRRVDVHADAVAGALDLDLGDAGPLHALGEQAADRHVLGDVVAVQLVGVPAALELAADAQAEPVRVDLLAHYRVLPFEPAPAAVAAGW